MLIHNFRPLTAAPLPFALSLPPKLTQSLPVRAALTALLASASFLITNAPLYAGVRCVTANPAQDCSTQMNIGWHADLHETSCSVIYTQKTDTHWSRQQTAPGVGERSDIFAGIESKTADGQDWTEDASFLNYGATLTHLQPDTEYMYKVSAGDTPTTQPARYFKTAGAREFTFLWFSDAHAYTPIPARVKNMNNIINAALSIDPAVDFLFSTGDVVAWGGSYSFWKKLFEQPFASRYMFADVIGNHDWMMRRNGGKSEFFRVAHNNPRNGYAGQQGISYWFIYGDVLFLTFNNEEMRTGPEAEAAAKTWAASVIEQQKGKYKRIFIAEHYQWFYGETGKASWYDDWKRFCDEHHVTLALAGNNHIYKRTHTLFNDQVVGDGLGTVYMDAPSCDGERGRQAGTLIENAAKIAFMYSSDVHSSPDQVKTIACVLVHVSPESITTRLVYIDAAGQIHLADEHTVKTVPRDVPRPGVPHHEAAEALEQTTAKAAADPPRPR